jgi:hypothetical protein
MTKYQRMQDELANTGRAECKAFGQSMKPILESGSFLTFEKRPVYHVGDIVFCKVKGRYIDAHKITKIDSQGRYLISNNHGHDNGWTGQIFGKVVRAELPNGVTKFFNFRIRSTFLLLFWRVAMVRDASETA